MKSWLTYLKGGFVDGVSLSTGKLPPADMPKPPNKPTAFPSWKTQVARSTSAIPRNDRQLANLDITTYRSNSSDSRRVVRDFAAANADLAGTRNSYLRTGIPEDYTIVAYTMDGQIDYEGTQLAQEMLRHITFLGDPSLGYNPITDLQSMSESLGIELLYNGGAMLELALNRQRSPVWWQAISMFNVEWMEEADGVYPEQVVGGQRRRLDIPTVFYVAADQDLLTPYGTGFFESAIQPVLADQTFLNNLRGAMQRSLNPRLVATILEEKFKDSLPPDILADPEKYQENANLIRQSVQDLLTDLAPEDAIAAFDVVEFDVLGAKDYASVGDLLETVQKLLESKVAAGAKTMPAILGRDSTSGAASTTAMLFLKNADFIRRKLNLLYSRCLTTGVRLMGADVYVEFKYAELDLRPSNELEAYKAMKQSRILELLSLGYYTDEQACIMLTGQLPPQGFTPRSGTMFKGNNSQTIENPDSQTSTMNKGGAPDNVKPTTPNQPKS